jgi:hypothetical protein
LNGVKTKCHMFVFRLSNLGKAIQRIYPAQAQGSSWKGHVEAVQVEGGIPIKYIPYDNLTGAVPRWCSGRASIATKTAGGSCSARTTASTPFYCQPGIAGHTKRRSRRGSGVVPPQQRFDPFLPPNSPFWQRSRERSSTPACC